MTTMNKPNRLDKADALTHWRALPDGQALRMTPIPYKTEGSKYGYDGIRIDGTRAFIDSVLSRLKPLLAGENDSTRLELNYTETADRETGRPTGQWVCYVRTHARGRDAQFANAIIPGFTWDRPA